MRDRFRNSGTMAVAIVLLLIAGLIILSVVRYYWVDSANDYYDTLIAAYIHETEGYEPEDRDRLKQQLLQGGMFIKMHRWDKESFVKDNQLYQDMVRAYEELLRKQEEERGSVMETLINL
jgi:hypothetical protein